MFVGSLTSTWIGVFYNNLVQVLTLIRQSVAWKNHAFYLSMYKQTKNSKVKISQNVTCLCYADPQNMCFWQHITSIEMALLQRHRNGAARPGVGSSIKGRYSTNWLLCLTPVLSAFTFRDKNLECL